MVGDFESMLMLSEHVPTEYCPSMNAITLATYLRYKSRPKEEQLKEWGTDKAMVDVLGRPIFCDGGWNAPVTGNQYLSAIGVIHDANNQRGPYSDQCAKCIV